MRSIQRPVFAIISPSLLVAMAYFQLSSIWAMWTICTMKYPSIGSQEEFRLLTESQFTGVCIANAILAALLLLDARAAFGRGPAMKTAHLVGITMAAGGLIAHQLTAQMIYGPLKIGS